jgi:hypothetical protein
MFIEFEVAQVLYIAKYFLHSNKAENRSDMATSVSLERRVFADEIGWIEVAAMVALGNVAIRTCV